MFIGKIDRYFRFVRKRKHFVVVGFYGHGSKFSVFCNERRAWKTKFERYCANVVVSKAVAIFLFRATFTHLCDVVIDTYMYVYPVEKKSMPG